MFRVVWFDILRVREWLVVGGLSAEGKIKWLGWRGAISKMSRVVVTIACGKFQAQDWGRSKDGGSPNIFGWKGRIHPRVILEIWILVLVPVKDRDCK